MTKIKDTDWLLFNIGGIDHKVSALEFKEFAKHVPLMPWEEHVANGGVVLHVKDATGTVKLNPQCIVYELDGTYKGISQTIGPGEELVFLLGTVTHAFTNNQETWNFGELTDVSKARDLSGMFNNCSNFNGTGMSDWDVSSAEEMNLMFFQCRNFNQDLSQWCVSNVHSNNLFDESCASWEAKNKPVWGTCPRGEDQ